MTLSKKIIVTLGADSNKFKPLAEDSFFIIIIEGQAMRNADYIRGWRSRKRGGSSMGVGGRT